MVKPKNSTRYRIALLQGGIYIAIEVHAETEDSIVGRTFAVGRNANDTGYTFAPVRFFRTPTISKNSIIFIEDMPEEMAQAYKQFLGTIIS